MAGVRPSRRRKFRNFKLRHCRVFTACELQTQRLFTALYTETYRGYSQGCPHDFPPHDLRHGWICRRWVIAKAAKGPTARDRTKNERGPPTEAALRLPVTQQQAHDPVANPLHRRNANHIVGLIQYLVADPERQFIPAKHHGNTQRLEYQPVRWRD